MDEVLRSIKAFDINGNLIILADAVGKCCTTVLLFHAASDKFKVIKFRLDLCC